MSLKPQLQQGTRLFREGKYKEALAVFDQAIVETSEGQGQFILYDSRAATHEALQNPKEALRDAKKTIDLAPQKWQGYARSARLFFKLHKFSASLKMADLAINRLKPGPEDQTRKDELMQLKNEVMKARIREEERLKVLDVLEKERIRRMQNHMLKLPIEIYLEIFAFVVDEDHTQLITLLHVCQLWRRVLWNAASFWRTLFLSEHQPDTKATLWLERSKGRLSELCLLPGLNLDTLDNIDWAHIRTLRLRNRRLIHSLNTKSILPNVEVLEISTEGIILKDDYFKSATNLKQLSIKNAVTKKAAFDSLNQLTSLQLSMFDCLFTYPDLLEILNNNPNLESLHFTYVNPFPAHLSQPQPQPQPQPQNPIPEVDLPHLTTLKSTIDNWSSTLLLLNIPNLQTLHFDRITNPQLNQHFTHWISTHPYCLTELYLKDTPVDKMLILELLRETPMIKILSVVGMYRVVNDLVDWLGRDGCGVGDRNIIKDERNGLALPCLCPRLAELDVSNNQDLETSVIHALVKHRVTLAEKSNNGDEGEDENRDGDGDGDGDGEVHMDEKKDEKRNAIVRVSKLNVLKMDGCSKIDANWIPWFRQHVPHVSCVYVAKKTQKTTTSARRINGF